MLGSWVRAPAGSHKNKAKRRQKKRQVLQYQRIVGLFLLFQSCLKDKKRGPKRHTLVSKSYPLPQKTIRGNKNKSLIALINQNEVVLYLNKSTAYTQLGIYQYPSVHFIDNRFTDRQAQPCTLCKRVYFLKSFEYLFPHILSYSTSSIADADTYTTGIYFIEYFYVPSSCVLERIREEVVQYLFDTQPV